MAPEVPLPFEAHALQWTEETMGFRGFVVLAVIVAVVWYLSTLLGGFVNLVLVSLGIALAGVAVWVAYRRYFGDETRTVWISDQEDRAGVVLDLGVGRPVEIGRREWDIRPRVTVRGRWRDIHRFDTKVYSAEPQIPIAPPLVRDGDGDLRVVVTGYGQLEHLDFMENVKLSQELYERAGKNGDLGFAEVAAAWNVHGAYSDVFDCIARHVGLDCHEYQSRLSQTDNTTFGDFAEMDGDQHSKTETQGSMTTMDGMPIATTYTHYVHIASRYRDDLVAVAALTGRELCRRMVCRWARGDGMRATAQVRMADAMMCATGLSELMVRHSENARGFWEYDDWVLMSFHAGVRPG